MEKPYVRENQVSLDVQPSNNDRLLKYPYIQQIKEKYNGTQVNSPGAGSRSTIGKTLYASKIPLAFLNQVCDYSQKPQENQPLSIYRKHLHHLALTQGIQHNKIPNLRTFTLDFPEPLTQDPNIGSNTSFDIQNPTNNDNQFSQAEISESSPVIHPQVLPKQKTPDLFPGVECAPSQPHSKMTSPSHASIACSNLAEDQGSTVEDMVVEELNEASCIEQNVLSATRADNKSSANRKALKEANHSGQTVESSMREGSLMVEAVTSSGISSTQDVDNAEQTNSSDRKSDEIITSPNSYEQANRQQSVLSYLNQADVWADRLFDLFQKMKINFSETCDIAHELHESLLRSKRAIDCIADASVNLRELKKGKVAVVKSKEVAAEVQQIAEENQAERKEEENQAVRKEEENQAERKEEENQSVRKEEENQAVRKGEENSKNQDRDNEVRKTTRGHIRTFILPPEYDPHDTRWTLKYRENDPELNLVELVPGSSVFINSLKLAHCKLTAKNSKELARMLLVEIFSMTALSVCSLTGVRANAFDISGTNVRPGLDEKARMTILTFVEKHAVEKKWGPFDSQSVINSLRSKIQDIRAKHGKTA
ncbi:uncharacterized protein LOC126978076 [Leptidea sinapis]|uniref:uncharacterized protein LOC126978076 n=1 Tax=Leptidea sinapis TaxID=189913 RepID=UPI0021C4BF26|nr:uncharacterized protein LOC126978076 [Leptidea sinapis]